MSYYSALRLAVVLLGAACGFTILTSGGVLLNLYHDMIWPIVLVAASLLIGLIMAIKHTDRQLREEEAKASKNPQNPSS